MSHKGQTEPHLASLRHGHVCVVGVALRSRPRCLAARHCAACGLWESRIAEWSLPWLQLRQLQRRRKTAPDRRSTIITARVLRPANTDHRTPVLRRAGACLSCTRFANYALPPEWGGPRGPGSNDCAWPDGRGEAEILSPLSRRVPGRRSLQNSLAAIKGRYQPHPRFFGPRLITCGLAVGSIVASSSVQSVTQASLNVALVKDPNHRNCRTEIALDWLEGP